MKIFLVGHKGWLGQIFIKEALKRGHYVFHSDALRLGNTFSFEGFDFDVMVNFAAKKDIDWCEKNIQETFVTNVFGAWELAKFCKQWNKKYVFMSSACIFESKDRHDVKYEDTKPNPQCFYTETKAMAEKLIMEANPDALIVRPRLPISEVPHKMNTLNKLLNYSEINTANESVTVVEDMMPVFIDLIEKNEKGIFHLVNKGKISPSKLATMLGHKFKKVSKKYQDRVMREAKRAHRVTTYVGSKRIKLLPFIGKRICAIIKNYKDAERKNISN